jgi:serine/threonine-protein kinase RsbW
MFAPIRRAGPAPVTEAARIHLPARLESLPRFAQFIADAAARHGADKETAYALRLAVEELCTNTIKYGYAGSEPGDIALDFAADADRFVLTLSDRGKPFDPRNAPRPDLSLSAEERPIGGLGVHLVMSLMDEVSYRSDPGRGNVLTLVRRRRQTTQ